VAALTGVFRQWEKKLRQALQVRERAPDALKKDGPHDWRNMDSPGEPVDS